MFGPAPASQGGGEELLTEAELGPHWGRPAWLDLGSYTVKDPGLHQDGRLLVPVSGLYIFLWFWALEGVEEEEQAGARAGSTSLWKSEL